MEKERRKNAKLSTGAYDKRRAEVAEMSVVKIRQELKGHKVEEWSGDDGGLLKAKVFQLYGLGEPPEKFWTKSSAVYMLDERGYVYEPKEVGTKQAAVATLGRIKEGDGQKDEGGAGASTTPRR